MPSKRERKLISKNRSAHHEYFIDETFECGIELSGTEVKSIRERACQITDTFALIRGGECWLVGLHIHPYSHGGVWNRDPDRRRRLLLHRKEIDFLDGKLRNRGYALVPLELYFNTDGRVKLLLGLGRGKKLYDKRDTIAKNDMRRQAEKDFRTGAKTWPSATSSARLTAPSRSATARHMTCGEVAYCDCPASLTVLTHVSQRRRPLWASPFLWVHTSMRFNPGLGEWSLWTKLRSLRCRAACMW